MEGSALFDRVCREVLIQAGHHFFDALLHIFVQGRNDGGHIFPAYRLVMVVVVRPYGRAGLEVAHLQFETHFCRNGAAGKLLEIVEPSTNEIVSRRIAAMGDYLVRGRLYDFKELSGSSIS